MDRRTLPVRVNHPRRIPGWSLPAERVPFGLGYKPSMALLPDGRLVLVAMVAPPPDEELPDGKLHEWTGIWWSADGGRTWSDMKRIKDMIGREQWLTCTSSGTLFASSHHLIQDITNEYGYVGSWLHRSTDGGETWERTRATVDGELRCGVPEAEGSHTSRNVVELRDGTLLFGVSICNNDIAYMWRSEDNGETWDKTGRAHIRGYYENLDGFFCEDFTYLNDAGTLLHWCRLGPFGYAEDGSARQGMFPMADDRVTPQGDDGIDRMIWTRSVDNGLTWSRVQDFGDYAAHYPRVLKLRDGRLLLTYTQRAIFYPLGLRAALSYDDGDTWDLDYDQIVIEGSTPWGTPSGGGFGNTVQLGDATLVSCYSYRDAEDNYSTEVARWRLP